MVAATFEFIKDFHYFNILKGLWNDINGLKWLYGDNNGCCWAKSRSRGFHLSRRTGGRLPFSCRPFSETMEERLQGAVAQFLALFCSGALFPDSARVRPLRYTIFPKCQICRYSDKRLLFRIVFSFSVNALWSRPQISYPGYIHYRGSDGLALVQ